MDGATPDGTVEGLAALAKGRLLSQASTDRLIGIMDKVRTGKRRLKGGLERGWTLAHKTGTGPDLRGASVGINDVGLLTAPDGRVYAVAVYIAHTRAPTAQRLAFMQKVSELVEARWSGGPAPSTEAISAAGEPPKAAPAKTVSRRARHGHVHHGARQAAKAHAHVRHRRH